MTEKEGKDRKKKKKLHREKGKYVSVKMEKCHKGFVRKETEKNELSRCFHHTCTKKTGNETVDARETSVEIVNERDGNVGNRQTALQKYRKGDKRTEIVEAVPLLSVQTKGNGMVDCRMTRLKIKGRKGKVSKDNQNCSITFTEESKELIN